MKKLLCILTLLLSFALLASCGEHVHKFSVWSVTKEATCAEQGVQSRTCSSCGFIEQLPIATVGHTETVDGAVSATCEEDGKTEGKSCSACGAVLVKQDIIPSTGHKYDGGKIVSSATCVQSGTMKYTCTVSGCYHSYTESYSLPVYTAAEINSQSLKYVGEIITYDKSGSELGLGTGFVYTGDGKIITNFHVIDGAYSAKITINGEEYKIKSVLSYDKTIDLAILKIDATGLTAANLCISPVNVGDTVYAIGSSRGMTNTFSQGIITYADRVVDGVSHIQHDASITNGNSGGPLINQYGEVIGINSWLLTNSQNLNFAVSANELNNLENNKAISLKELYKKNYGTYDTFVNYVITHGTYSAEYECYEILDEYSYTDRRDYYLLTYYPESGNILVSNAYYDYEDNEWSVMTTVIFNRDTSELYYSGTYDEYDVELNCTIGYFNPATFTSSTKTLPYESLEGLSNSKDILMELYCSCIADTLDWIDSMFKDDNVGLTLSNLGFTSYK